MATEVARCPCKSGKIPDDPGSEAGQALKDCLNTLTGLDGFQRAYWGMEVENTDVFRLFVDWDSVDAHVKFQKSEEYQPFCDRLAFFLDLSKIELHHTKFTPHPPEASLSDLSAPVTEIITIYFPESYSTSDQDTFSSNFKKLVSAIEGNASTYRGSAGGWAEESVSLPPSSDDSSTSSGGKAKVYNALIAWDSVQAHMDFRETPVFKDNIHHLRGAKDLTTVNVVHASCTMVTRGGGVGDDQGESVQEEVLNPQQGGGKQSVKTRADGTTTKNDGGTTNSLKKERQGRA